MSTRLMQNGKTCPTAVVRPAAHYTNIYEILPSGQEKAEITAEDKKGRGRAVVPYFHIDNEV